MLEKTVKLPQVTMEILKHDDAEDQSQFGGDYDIKFEDDKQESSVTEVSSTTKILDSESEHSDNEKVINININLHVHDSPSTETPKDEENKEEGLVKTEIGPSDFEIEVDGEKKTLSPKTISKINDLIYQELYNKVEDGDMNQESPVAEQTLNTVETTTPQRILKEQKHADNTDSAPSKPKNKMKSAPIIQKGTFKESPKPSSNISKTSKKDHIVNSDNGKVSKNSSREIQEEKNTKKGWHLKNIFNLFLKNILNSWINNFRNILF